MTPAAAVPTPVPVIAAPTPAPLPASPPVPATRNPQPATAPTPPPAPAPDRTATANALQRERERMATERRIEERAAELERTAPPAATATSASADVKARIAAADAALSTGDLGAARTAYAELVDLPNLDRASALHIGENLYEAGDYRNAVRAFQRAGTFRAGEEPQRYAFALALYETGNYRAAKRELAAALPKLEPTPELQRNRAKIEGAID